ncbi:glycoside hydrolase family 78 protein [Hypoxylon trugodes]|uniref:glycoside hydrolase family 78 protein n=1 Tax=Hypoxylon trugodes TaxID=326681 RepID=UPI00218F4F6F|nr:glycoside hydrolase family 78 protein [Hypoxylon trugodes]KAI1391699.1 glycoside hydrolase family 78 protein [Hypoxylon trugodes]
MAEISISQVAFEHHREPLGIGEAKPRISWRFHGDASNWTQGGYSVEVQRDSEPELFHFNSSNSVLVPWPTVALSSSESATVRVRAYGQGDLPDTPWSDAVTVETGLFSKEDWSRAIMMGTEKKTEKNATHQPIHFLHQFSTNSTIEKARLYITAYGLYEAYINGNRVGNNVLAPGWQSYNHSHVYNTYDVTDLLQTGNNAIGIHVGEGWYAGRLGFFQGGTRNIWGDALGAMALLVIWTPTGKQVVNSYWGWVASRSGPLITAELYNGEVYDPRLEQTGWSSPDYRWRNDTNWLGNRELSTPYDQLVAPDGPPIRRVQEVQLQEILTSPTGKTILDFGQNLVGWLRLKVKGPSGTRIKLVHTEVLDHGEVATRPLRTATQTDEIILGEEPQTWEAAFTYKGFRYVQVENWPIEDTPLDEDAVVAVVVHSDLEEIGTFECSNPLINKLHHNIRWSMKGNFMSVPTDCPQRDERLGWTGDSHAFSPSANFLYDTSGFWRGWLRDLRSEQVKGVPPLVVPSVPGTGPPVATAIWGDAVVVNAWNTYLSSGDLDILREQYVGAKEWIDTGIPRNEDGLWDRNAFQLGDWLDPLSPPDDPGQATTSSSYVADAYLVYVTGLVGKMASELGLEDDRLHYEESVTNLKAAFREAWMSPEGRVAYETQTGLVLPLYFDLFKDGDEAVNASRRLQKIIEDNDYLVGTGFAGTHLLGLALSKYSLSETFYKMLLQTKVPSWLYQVKMNATTTWERWDSLLEDGSLNPGEMTSFNHYAVGSVANWIHQVIGGLAPVDPGWKTFKVQPIPGGNLTWAKTSYLSPYGKIYVEWSVDDTGFNLDLEVPPNTSAFVTLPRDTKNIRRVGSGKYHYSVAGFHL